MCLWCESKDTDTWVLINFINLTIQQNKVKSSLSYLHNPQNGTHPSFSTPINSNLRKPKTTSKTSRSSSTPLQRSHIVSSRPTLPKNTRLKKRLSRSTLVWQIVTWIRFVFYYPPAHLHSFCANFSKLKKSLKTVKPLLTSSSYSIMISLRELLNRRFSILPPFTCFLVIWSSIKFPQKRTWLSTIPLDWRNLSLPRLFRKKTGFGTSLSLMDLLVILLSIVI